VQFCRQDPGISRNSLRAYLAASARASKAIRQIADRGRSIRGQLQYCKIRLALRRTRTYCEQARRKIRVDLRKFIARLKVGIAHDSCRDSLIELKIRQRLHEYSAIVVQSIPGAAQL